MKNTLIKPLLILITLCVIVMIGAGSYMLLEEQDTKTIPTQNTALEQYEAKQTQTNTVQDQTITNTQTVKKTDSSYQTYTNNIHGFKVDYPKNWKQMPLDINLGDKQVHGAIFLLEDPQNPLIVEVITESLEPNEKSFNKYVELSEKSLEMMLNDLRITSTLNTELDGKQAKELTMTFKQGVLTFKAKAILTVNNDKGYIFLYMSLPQHFSNSLSTANKMIDSFEFI